MIASGFLLDLLSLFVRWIPIRGTIIDQTEHGIRWWRGRPQKVLSKPDFYLYVPWLGDITKHGIVPKVIESETQVVGLKDGTTLVVSIAVHYEIQDVLKWYMAVDDFDESFVNLLQIAVTETLATYTFKEWLAEDVLEDLRKRFRTLARRWGVRILDINFVNSGKTQPIHLTGVGTLIGD